MFCNYLCGSTINYYVDNAKLNNSGDGLSWSSAKKTITAAMNLAQENSQNTYKIWIKGSTGPYTESGSNGVLLLRNYSGNRIELIGCNNYENDNGYFTFNASNNNYLSSVATYPNYNCSQTSTVVLSNCVINFPSNCSAQWSAVNLQNQGIADVLYGDDIYLILNNITINSSSNAYYGYAIKTVALNYPSTNRELNISNCLFMGTNGNNRFQIYCSQMQSVNISNTRWINTYGDQYSTGNLYFNNVININLNNIYIEQNGNCAEAVRIIGHPQSISVVDSEFDTTVSRGPSLYTGTINYMANDIAENFAVQNCSFTNRTSKSYGIYLNDSCLPQVTNISNSQFNGEANNIGGIWIKPSNGYYSTINVHNNTFNVTGRGIHIDKHARLVSVCNNTVRCNWDSCHDWAIGIGERPDDTSPIDRFELTKNSIYMYGTAWDGDHIVLIAQGTGVVQDNKLIQEDPRENNFGLVIKGHDILVTGNWIQSALPLYLCTSPRVTVTNNIFINKNGLAVFGITNRSGVQYEFYRDPVDCGLKHNSFIDISNRTDVYTFRDDLGNGIPADWNLSMNYNEYSIAPSGLAKLQNTVFDGLLEGHSPLVPDGWISKCKKYGQSNDRYSSIIPN